MKPKLPFWYPLARPLFNWLADRKEKREADKALRAPQLVGYFIWNKGAIVAAAYKNARGDRWLKWLQGHRHTQMAQAQAWLDGDDSVERHGFIFPTPFVSGELDPNWGSQGKR